MQARTQSPWQDGAHVARPQHSTEQSRCLAGEEQASCASVVEGKIIANATTAAAAHNVFTCQTIKVSQVAVPHLQEGTSLLFGDSRYQCARAQHHMQSQLNSA